MKGDSDDKIKGGSKDKFIFDQVKKKYGNSERANTAHFLTMFSKL